MKKQFKNMNAYISTEDGKEVFTSYSSRILRIDRENNTIEVGEDFDRSRSTGKQVKIYFREVWGMDLGVADIRKALAGNGEVGVWKIVKNDNL